MVEVEWDKYENKIVLVVLNQVTSEDMLNVWNVFMNRGDQFVSFTNSVDEMTIWYDETVLDPEKAREIFPNFMYKGRYVGYLGINTCSFVEQAGLVKALSSVFSDQGIPIMYQTTYNNDYVLVPEEYEGPADRLINLVQEPHSSINGAGSF